MFTTVEQAIDYIHQRPKFHRENKLTIMKQALHLFGDPQKEFPTIHVTGTNGKGSVSHLVSELLGAHGYRVGLFTSPYILRFNERIQIDDQQIPDEDLLTLTNQVVTKLVRAELNLTEFELVTTLMFVYFAQQQIDVGVIEVGIGGEHDRTNVIEAEIGVIASIGMDHQDLIGPTLVDIAREKSGIIKTGQTTILGQLPADTIPVVTEKIATIGAQGIWFDQQLQVSKLKLADGVATFDLKVASEFIEGRWILKKLQMPAFASWQVWDASLAVAAAIAFMQRHHAKPSIAIVRERLKHFQVPVRLEVLSQQPLILLDGAHNPAAFKALIQGVKQSFAGQPIYLTLGMMADKDIAGVAELLAHTNWQVTWTAIEDNPRAATKSDLEERLGAKIRFYEHWQESLQAELQEGGGEGVYIFAGSFYLITNVRHYLRLES
jgi:dihydrofolate synthase/folylpolyglutamate synthase